MANETPDIALTEPGSLTRSTTRGVLKNGPFRLLWFSQVLSQIAGHVLNFALVIKIYQLTESNFLVSILVALVSIPPILFSSLAGVYADNFNRKYILLLSNVSRGVVVIGFLVFGTIPLAILVFAFIISTISQFFGPAESASIASLVKRRDYFSANSLFIFTTYFSFLIGYSFAGPALKHLGEGRTYDLLIVSFALASMANFLLPSLRDHLGRQQGRSYFDRAFGSLKKDFFEGLRFIKGKRIVLAVVVQLSIVFAIERSVIALLPDLAQNTFRFSIDEISYYLITPTGLGAFIGAILANRLKVRMPKMTLIFTGLLIDGVCLFLLPLYGFADKLMPGNVDMILYIVLVSFLSGLADVFIIIAGQTLLHELTPPDTRGRVFGSLVMFMNLVGLPLIVGVGYLASLYSIPRLLFVLGIVVTVLILLNAFVFRKVAREYESGGSATAE